jgi:BirA family transcriptional regulator, biotin operon repressor / biotin---[acetyl-CoA-carboxylase] ligase
MTADGTPRGGPLDAAVLRAGVLGWSSGWSRLDVVVETGSTNADLIARANAGEDIDGAVLIAERQTAGRGRQGRTWSDGPGAQVAMSVGIRVADVPTDRWGWLPLATGVSIVETVGRFGGEVTLKWPNDVLAHGRKLAGILAEVAAVQRTIVVGIGLNVTLPRDDVAAPQAISLAELGIDVPSRNEIVSELLGVLGEHVRGWRESGGADARLAAKYRETCSTLGALVRVELPGAKRLVGIARDVDEQGRLCIDSDGEEVVLAAGDVVHLRPTASADGDLG